MQERYKDSRYAERLFKEDMPQKALLYTLSKRIKDASVNMEGRLRLAMKNANDVLESIHSTEFDILTAKSKLLKASSEIHIALHAVANLKRESTEVHKLLEEDREVQQHINNSKITEIK